MTDNEILRIAINEINEKTWGVTEQFLQIHDVVRENGVPVVARIDKEDADTFIVYFPVAGEKFFWVVKVCGDKPEVSGVYVEAYNSIVLIAGSETLSGEEIVSLTKLKPLYFRTKGEQYKKRILQRSFARFEPFIEPDSFENKLSKFVGFLEQDKEGIERLNQNTTTGIQVAIEFHHGNQMLGGPHINAVTLKRIAALNLSIDFDLYTGGHQWP
jgi:hypothetical protein